MDTTAAFRKIVHGTLFDLAEQLGDFEQTTHGSLYPEPSFRQVLTALAEAYEDPRAFTISELDQRLRNFLKRVNHAASPRP